MKTIRIDEVQYTIPEGLHDISLETYFKASKTNTPLDYCRELTGIPKDIISKTGYLIPALVAEHFSQEITDLLPEDRSMRIDGHLYWYAQDIRKITLGQFVDIIEVRKQHEVEPEKAIPLVMAILFRRYGKTYEPEQIEATAAKILKLQAHTSLKTYKRYLEQEAELLKEYETLFEPPAIITAEQAKQYQRSKEFSEHWGWYSSIVALAKYWGKDKDYASGMNLIEALNDLSYMKDETELQSAKP
jgi:hypothetical protein